MRKLYNEFFAVSENGRIREKVMIARVVLTVTVMVVCLAAMSMTAYAYFSHEVVTSNNIIKSAEFSIEVTSQDVDITAVNSKTFTANLTGGSTYTFTVKGSGDATTGFCTVSASDCYDGTYHTRQIYKNNEGYDVISFSIKPTKDTVVTITAHWGTSSKYQEFQENGVAKLYINDKDTVEMSIGTPPAFKAPRPSVDNTDDNESNEDNADVSDEIIEESTDESVDESTDEGTDEGTDESQPTVNENGEIIHIVKDGENLSRIANLYGRNSRDLAYYNELKNPDTIKVGQEIIIPPSDWKRPKDEVESSPEASTPEASTPDESTAVENESSQ